jgi:bifunctional aspartokinase / homoserine dehydrogenase 1
MKVLKFGGTSVGSVESILNVKKIVEARTEPVIVVVSALGGITDRLIATAKMAQKGDEAYLQELAQIEKRHFDMIEACFPTDKTAKNGEIAVTMPPETPLLATVKDLLSELADLYKGVFLLKELTDKTLDEIVSFGERISSHIVTALIDGAVRRDSLEFIRTVYRHRKNELDAAATYPLINKAFADFLPAGSAVQSPAAGEALGEAPENKIAGRGKAACGSGHGKTLGETRKIAIVPGFISRDSGDGKITNLGRGGSDYTASILAAGLGAECLEIWTDVDGFMTADPRVIKTSYVIEELSFTEAMELCNFGAKVIYPPTLYPVYVKDIPLLVKNTFHPEAPGSVIKRDCRKNDRVITGITSINNCCLLTVSGTSMVGIVGVNSRIFSTLADNSISVFLASQSSSETSISLGLREEDSELAAQLLNTEFAYEIERGSMNPVSVTRELSTIAIVGENMKKNCGIPGKLFTTLGRNGINAIAVAQGSSETNISFVVERKFLRKSLNVIHDSFFLSEYQEVNLFICGIGTVGGSLLRQIDAQKEKLMRERNLKLNVVGIARSTRGVFDRNGVDLEKLSTDGIALDVKKLRDEVIGMNIFNSVFVDCTASAEIAALYKDFFQHGISVVAANKIAASSTDYAEYKALKEEAYRRNIKFLFETNVGAGLPVIRTVTDLTASGDRVERIEAVLSGTLNYILNTVSETVTLSQAVRQANELGFSEPDPRVDLSGKDVVRKIVILAREAGYAVNMSDVRTTPLLPAEYFDLSIEEFWRRLPELDTAFEAHRRSVRSRGLQWRFVARLADGQCSVGLHEVDSSSPLFRPLEGSNNIVLLTTERYHLHPLIIQGYGAGAEVTAAGVFADIMRAANI